ncbi:MAG: methyltransferase domain-containing protein [Chitinispirillaceae bacterium]|nr:methyltransferase domain-containing protein [Chitinispirillaceae bacterium]
MKKSTGNTPDIHQSISPKPRIAAHFGRKVSHYGKYAIIQQKLLDNLLPSILKYGTPGRPWADFGCGNGDLEKKLLQNGWYGSMTGIDIAFDSLHFCIKKLSSETKWCCADAEQPPFRPATFEGLVAASMIQWTSRPDLTITTLASLIEPGGYFVFSLFTEDAFRELYETRKRHNLPIPAALYREEMVEPILHRLELTPLTIVPFSETVYFSSARELLRHLSSIGSTGTSSRPLTRRNLQKFCDDLENGFGTDKGVPLTYKALFGAARKGEG